ncbi:MAG: four helix bundle protein [Balneolaceae bacterium]|nr:four helix bundle protein [Balneolaceae bacterium]
MKKPSKTFQELIVWRKAHQFVLNVYSLTSNFPKHEIYGLTSQFRRASISIAANIAEGYKKQGTADKARYLNIAHGSLEECRYYIILTKDLEYGNVDALHNSIEEVSKLLYSYRKAILNNSS